MAKKYRGLHGHAVIELHNHKTGFRERIEHDNDLTDGITDYLLSCGWFNNSPFRNDAWRALPLYRSLLGGILLFDTEIEKVNGVLPTTMPAGVKMIANGAYGVANNSATTEMATFNTNESSFSEAGYSYVYDWTTSQGNGEIACLSLTSELGGYIGYGNSVSRTSLSAKRSLIENQNPNVYSAGSPRKAFCIIGDTIYYALTDCESDTQLIYYSAPVGIDGTVELFKYAKRHAVDLPNTVKGSGYRYVISADRGFGVVNLPGGSYWRNSDGARPLAIYNIATGLWEEHTARPEYDEEIASIHASSIHDDIICIGGHYAPGSVVTRLDTLEVVAQVTPNNAVFFKHSPDLYMRGGDGNILHIKDDVNDTQYPTNGSVSDLTGGNTNNAMATMEFAHNRFYVSTGYSGLVRMYRNPLYLATVNNLEETVTKTSDMSMKVTYTITPAAE